MKLHVTLSYLLKDLHMYIYMYVCVCVCEVPRTETCLTLICNHKDKCCVMVAYIIIHGNGLNSFQLSNQEPFQNLFLSKGYFEFNFCLLCCCRILHSKIRPSLVLILFIDVLLLCV
jgi:hypothetical protein